MKKLLISFTLIMSTIFLITGCKQKQQPQDVPDESVSPETQAEESSNDLLIQPRIGVGKVRFGMTIKEMKDILGKPDFEEMGISYVYSSLGIQIITVDKATIDRICCGNPENMTDPRMTALEQACKFKTTEGIGIGSTEAQIIEAYGEPTARQDNRLMYKDKRMTFTVVEDKVIGIFLQK